MMIFAYLTIGLTGVIAGVVGGITSGIVLIAVTNGMGSVGRLAFESVIQREAPDANRARRWGSGQVDRMITFVVV